MEITGHGFGPNSTVEVTYKSGNRTVESTPGRGIQFDPAKAIGPQDGCIVGGAVAVRDCGRQTAIDLIALVKTIRQTRGLALGINQDKIFYVGQSFGSIYGSLFHAVEPNVKAAVINAGGGSFTDVARLSVTGQPLAAGFVNSLGLPFQDAYPFRDQGPQMLGETNSALSNQAAFEASEWLGMLGDPLAYAPHFKTEPLAGVPAKATLFQFGLGDLEVPNPTESALVRAADGRDTTWYFRFDYAFTAHPELLYVMTGPLPILPHRILSNQNYVHGGFRNAYRYRRTDAGCGLFPIRRRRKEGSE